MLTADKLGCWLALHELTDLFIINELCPHSFVFYFRKARSGRLWKNERWEVSHTNEKLPESREKYTQVRF
jgi:hypothetical protein